MSLHVGEDILAHSAIVGLCLVPKTFDSLLDGIDPFFKNYCKYFYAS